MRTVLAFLLDAYREATHTKMFQILVVITGAFLLALFSVGYEEGNLNDGLSKILSQDQLNPKGITVREISRSRFDSKIEASFSLEDREAYVRALARWKREPWQLETWDLEARETVSFEGENESWRAVIQFKSTRPPISVLREVIIDRDTVDSELARGLEFKLKNSGIRGATLSVVSSDGWKKAFRVTGETSAFHLTRVGRISVFFGTWTFDPPFGMSIAQVVYAFEYSIFEYGACLLGVVLALIVTAGMVPNLLHRGTIEFWLSKPVGRTQLVALKFIGGIVFIVPIGLAILGGSFLVLSLRSGYWNWWYLASLGVFISYFAILHALSMLFGMMTRSTVAALLLTAVVWVLSSVVYQGRKGMAIVPPEDRPEALSVAVDVLSVALPRTAETGGIAEYFMLKGLHMGGEEAVVFARFSLVENLVHTTAYTLLVLFLCVWIFQRRDF
ncbi:MAG TPA: ABC transporter permease [Planctomycetota bacterium]|nr:ABC transporter permease [Planctomycetota bacterium]